MEKQAYWSWINGKYTTSPQITASCGGVQHGYGVFETLYYSNGLLHLWPAHLKRLETGAAFYDLTFPLPPHELLQIVKGLITKNSLSEAKIRLSLSASSTDYAASNISTALHITATPYQRSPAPLNLYSFKAKTLGCSLNTHKSSSYASYQLARRKAVQAGGDEALLLDTQARPVECSTSNIFFFDQGSWFTPNLDEMGLRGVQRECVIGAFEKSGTKIHEELRPLSSTAAAFITNSLVGIQHVDSIDGVPTAPLPRTFHPLKAYWRTLEKAHSLEI